MDPQLLLSLELPDDRPLNSPAGLSSITYESNFTSIVSSLSSVFLDSPNTPNFYKQPPPTPVESTYVDDQQEQPSACTHFVVETPTEEPPKEEPPTEEPPTDSCVAVEPLTHETPSVDETPTVEPPSTDDMDLAPVTEEKPPPVEFPDSISVVEEKTPPLVITDSMSIAQEKTPPTTTTSIHDIDINTMNSSHQWYANITSVIHEIDRLNIIIDKRLVELKNKYASLIQSNHKKIFLFCLDSFYFQYRVLHMEQENLTRLFLTTKNRIYGDYFKLYGLMSMQLKDIFHVNISSLNMDVDKFVKYDDLETLVEYTPSMVNDLFMEINRVLQILHTHYKTQQIIRDAHLANTRDGFTITSFVDTLEYENDMIHRQWLLYRNFLENFCDSQYEYLIKLRARYELVVTEIGNEVLRERDD